jgi:hypothetical protein
MRLPVGAAAGRLSLLFVASFAVLSALGASSARAQTVSLLGGMHLSLGPPEGQVIGAPTDVTTAAAPPQGSSDSNTVYIVETQPPPGYAQPVYVQSPPPSPPAPTPESLAAQRAQNESDGRIPRVIFGPIIGYSVGVGIGSIGLLVGALAGSCFDFSGDGFGSTKCVVGILAGAFGGMLIGMPLGVTWAGGWFNGMGTYGTSLLGALAGTGLAVLISALAQNYEAVFAGALLPLAGAVVGYELSSSARAQASLGGVSLAPVFENGRAVGATGGVRVAF